MLRLVRFVRLLTLVRLLKISGTLATSEALFQVFKNGTLAEYEVNIPVKWCFVKGGGG